MLKRSIAILLPVLLIVGSIYLYFHLKKAEVPENTAIKAIPIDASFIFESRKTLPLWKTLSQTSNTWKELLDVPYFSGLNRQCKTLDSVIRENPEIETILENHPLFVSAHTDGMNRFNYLFVCSVPETTSQSALTTYLYSLKDNSPEDNLQYEETTIHCLKMDEKKMFYYTFSNGIFIASFSPALVKESLRQLESGISLMNNAYFTKVLNTSGEQVAANIFINLQTCTNVFSNLFNKSFLPALSSIQNFGEWMELDITIRPDEFIMSGFTDCDSTGCQFLNLFERQSSQEVKAASVAPANTAFMLCHEFSDYGTFHKNYLQYLSIHNKNRGREEWINRTEQNYGLNIESYFYPWINNEAVQIITEPSDSTLENDTYVLMEANDINAAMNKLSALADTIASGEKIESTDSAYMQHEIRNLNLDNITGIILGGSFNGVTKSWFTSVGNYVVFANSVNALKTFIYEYEDNNTLEKDTYYKDYIKQHVESESGIYIYNNMTLSPTLYAKYLDNSYAAGMKKYKSVFSKFHTASIQFTYLQGMFYTDLYFKRNPSADNEISPLWQITIDTTLATSPRWVTDYITHGKYVLAEDKNESVYLINNNGNILWKKKINGYIQSPVFEVDALKNHKIQYLFNTRNNICLLDRKGNEVDGFPVKLKHSATAPLAVLDYDNDKKYRLLLPCSDLKIYEYNINGKPVKGWTMPETKETVKCSAHYLRVDKKDYVIFVDDAGKVYVFDRKGNEKLNLDNRMPSHIRNFYTAQGKSLSDSYIMAIDSLGTVFRLSLSGELSTIQYLKGPKNHPLFAAGPADSNGKQEMIFLSGTDLQAYNTNKTEQFHAAVKNKPDNLLLFSYPGHSFEIGTVDHKNEQIYLWDDAGKLSPGFPLYGSENFSIADMKNDGSLYLVTGAGDKIYVYSLQ